MNYDGFSPEDADSNPLRLRKEEWIFLLGEIEKRIHNHGLSIEYIVRQAVAVVRNKYPNVSIRVRNTGGYIEQLRRGGYLQYRTNVKSVVYVTREQFYNIIRERSHKNTIRDLFREYGVILGWQEFARRWNNREEALFKLYVDVQKMVSVIVPDNPSISLGNIATIFRFRKETIPSLTGSVRYEFSKKAEILSCDRLKQFLSDELRDIQKSGLHTEFHQALRETIKKWNRVHSEHTGVQLPTVIKPVKAGGVSLCSIMGIDSTKIADILRGLGLSEDTWINSRGKIKNMRQTVQENTSYPITVFSPEPPLLTR